jgi:hypothetical protein
VGVSLEYRILHHRQSGSTGGHWDLVENTIPYRASTATEPHGDGSLCLALTTLGREGWRPVMDLVHAQTQSGESFMLLARGAGSGTPPPGPGD